jgi:hypothetical protein
MFFPDVLSPGKLIADDISFSQRVHCKERNVAIFSNTAPASSQKRGRPLMTVDAVDSESGAISLLVLLV